MFNMNKLIKITYIGGIIMSILTSILGTLVAIEFFYIFYLETVATVSANTARVFKMEEEELRRPSVTTLFKNQGVYNGLIGV